MWMVGISSDRTMTLMPSVRGRRASCRDDALYDAKVAGRNVVRTRPRERIPADPARAETPSVDRSRAIARGETG